MTMWSVWWPFDGSGGHLLGLVAIGLSWWPLGESGCHLASAVAIWWV